MVADELSQNKARSTLALSRYPASAAERAAKHSDPLSIAGKVKDLAGVHKMLWREENPPEEILQIGFIIGRGASQYRWRKGQTGELVPGPRSS
jgi:hypothetical protein